jgi:hypothetical protein
MSPILLDMSANLHVQYLHQRLYNRFLTLGDILARIWKVGETRGFNPFPGMIRGYVIIRDTKASMQLNVHPC